MLQWHIRHINNWFSHILTSQLWLGHIQNWQVKTFYLNFQSVHRFNWHNFNVRNEEFGYPKSNQFCSYTETVSVNFNSLNFIRTWPKRSISVQTTQNSAITEPVAPRCLMHRYIYSDQSDISLKQGISIHYYNNKNTEHVVTIYTVTQVTIYTVTQSLFIPWQSLFIPWHKLFNKNCISLSMNQI